MIPADWSIAYPAFLNDSDPFSFTLTIAGDKELPTRPTLRIVEVQGMQRLDNDIDILNETAITFFFNEDANAAVTDCSKDKDGAGCYDILEARYKSTIQNSLFMFTPRLAAFSLAPTPQQPTNSSPPMLQGPLHHG